MDLGERRSDEPPTALAREEGLPRCAYLLPLVLSLEKLLHHRLHLADLRSSRLGRLPAQDHGHEHQP